MIGPGPTFRVLLASLALLGVNPSPKAAAAVSPPESGPEVVEAAKMAVQYGILGYGESGTFEGMRPLNPEEMDRVIKVLGLYLGRILDRAGTYEAKPSETRDLVLGLWSLAQFLKRQRSNLQDLMDSTETTFDQALDREPLWSFRVVEEMERHLRFRLDSLRFLTALEGQSDPILSPIVRQLARLLAVLDGRSREMEGQLERLLDRF